MDTPFQTPEELSSSSNGPRGGVFRPPVSYFLTALLLLLALIVTVLSINCGIIYSEIHGLTSWSLLQRALSDRVLGQEVANAEANLKQINYNRSVEYTNSIQQWQQRLASLRARISASKRTFESKEALAQIKLSTAEAPFLKRLALLDAKIAAAKASFQQEQSVLEMQIAKWMEKDNELVASRAQRLSKAKADIKLMHKYGPAQFAAHVIAALEVENAAATKLAAILSISMKPYTASELPIRKVTAKGFAIKGAGAGALAVAIVQDARALTEAVGGAATLKSSGPGPRGLARAYQNVSAAGTSLQQAIAESRPIAANIDGVVSVPSSAGPLPASQLHVLLIPKVLSRSFLIQTLGRLQPSLMAGWKLCKSLLAKWIANGWLASFQQSIWDQRDGTRVTINFNEQQAEWQVVESARRIVALRKLLAARTQDIDARKLFIDSWNFGEPFFYQVAEGLPLTFHVQRYFDGTNLPWFLPEGVAAWTANCALSYSTTDATGAFQFQSVPAGAYYVYACNLTDPHMVWMVPVIVTSRHTVHVTLDATDPIETAH